MVSKGRRRVFAWVSEDVYERLHNAWAEREERPSEVLGRLLERELRRLEKRHGGPFPQRTDGVRRGRPPKAGRRK